MRPLLVASFLATVTTAAALATPSDDVVNAFTKMAGASSYHLAVQSAQGQTMDIDTVRPDKLHMVMGGGKAEMIRTGGDTYVKVNGNWMKLPMAMPQLEQQLGAVNYVRSIGANPKQAQVDDLGTQSVDGGSYHAYKVTSQDGKPATVYVDGSGYPARVDVSDAKGTSIVRFSKYNAPVTIEAPI